MKLSYSPYPGGPGPGNPAWTTLSCYPGIGVQLRIHSCFTRTRVGSRNGVEERGAVGEEESPTSKMRRASLQARLQPPSHPFYIKASYPGTRYPGTGTGYPYPPFQITDHDPWTPAWVAIPRTLGP
eukprot:3694725-Rhodomonas_salina.1